MEKQDLIELREALNKLNNEERKQRDLYQKALHNIDIEKGPIIEGPPIGYASIDKPNLGYYDNEAILGEIPQATMYEYLEKIFNTTPNSYCLEYYGTKIRKKKFLKIVDELSKKYSKMGIGKWDIVSMISVTTPELIYTIYALNKIGAIINLIDPRLSADNLKEKCMESKLIVSLDIVEPKLKNILRNDQKVIYYPISESFSPIVKKIYNSKNPAPKINSANAISWSEFMKIPTNDVVLPKIEQSEDDVAILESTSGTTGPSKLAMLTNKGANSVAWQYEHSGIPHTPGSVFLNIMPAFLSYGVIAGIHMPLTLGFKTVIIPKRELKDMGKYISKYKPQAYLDIPNGYTALKNSPEIINSSKDHDLSFNLFNSNIKIKCRKRKDLSFISSPGVGGDHLSQELEEATNKFLKEHNNNHHIAKGYGMTELSSAAIVNVSEACNSIGSVGVAFPKTKIKVVNPETGEEVMYNEEGELYISSPALFKGYYKNEEATNKEIVLDENGEKWIKTGDYFTVAPNGELFFKGRKKMMFVRPDGHNNHPLEMTELVLKHPAVKDAFTVGIQSPYDIQGKYPKVSIVLKDEYKGQEEQIQKELEDLCMSNFSQRDVPYYYNFRDEIPYTPGGKIDFISLEKEGTDNTRKAQILIEEKGDTESINKPYQRKKTIH